MNSRKPTDTSPITAITRAEKTIGSARVEYDTAMPQPARIRTQSSSEPSCAPHTADSR